VVADLNPELLLEVVDAGIAAEEVAGDVGAQLEVELPFGPRNIS
jgi:hypothetical protein